MFVFVGDQNQLPPLEHDFCPALSNEYFANRYGLKGNSFSLTNIHRQVSDSDITKLAKKFIPSFNETIKEIPLIEEIENDVSIIQNSEVVNIFFDLFFKNKHSVKIITATNAKADYYNFLIKEKLSTGATGKYEPYLISNSYLEPQEGDILQLFNNTGGISEYPL